MIIVYIWLGVVVLIAAMLIAKLILTLILAAKEKRCDWSNYNMLMLYLAAFAFLPVMVLANLVKRAK